MSADFIGTSLPLLSRFACSLGENAKEELGCFLHFTAVVFLPDIPAEMWLALGFSSVDSKQPRTANLLTVCVCVHRRPRDYERSLRSTIRPE